MIRFDLWQGSRYLDAVYPNEHGSVRAGYYEARRRARRHREVNGSPDRVRVVCTEFTPLSGEPEKFRECSSTRGQ